MGRPYTVTLGPGYGLSWQLKSSLHLLPPTSKWTHGEFLVCKPDSKLLFSAGLGKYTINVAVNAPPVAERPSMFKAKEGMPPSLDDLIEQEGTMWHAEE